MARQVKCQWCGKKDSSDLMVVVEEKVTKSGKTTRKYCHEACSTLYFNDKELKRKEQEELDQLIKVIKEVHGIHQVPQRFYPYLQQLRNGSVMIRNREQKYKEGFPYSVIAETYEYCAKNIKWAKENKNFDSLMNELKYCWFIVNDKIVYVNKRIQVQQAKLQERLNQIEDDPFDYEQREIIYKKAEHENDISAFLDE